MSFNLTNATFNGDVHIVRNFSETFSYLQILTFPQHKSVKRDAGFSSKRKKKDDDSDDDKKKPAKKFRSGFPECRYCKKRTHHENDCWFHPSGLNTVRFLFLQFLASIVADIPLAALFHEISPQKACN